MCSFFQMTAGFLAISVILMPVVRGQNFTPQPDPVYQYSVPVPDSKEMRAYLWLPPKCQHVRGVILGIQNMLEQFILADPDIRQAATDCNLGIVWITPGDDFGGPVKSPYHRFNPAPFVADHIDQVLKNLAVESGYAEIADAPMIVTGHSAATPFVWGMANLRPNRMIAIMPFKGWFLGLPPGIPALHMSSGYAEVGGKDWGESYVKDRQSVMHIRSAGADSLISEAVDFDAGHYEWNPAMGKIVAMFIRKAVARRLPENAPRGPVTLQSIDPASGVLLDPDKLGTVADQPVPVAGYSGDPKTALWYFDAELARTINDTMIQSLAKKPQVIDFIDNGQPAPLVNSGVAGIGTHWLDDGCSFQVQARFLDKSPTTRLYDGADVGHSNTASILFKTGSGCLKQTGPDTFRPWVHRGGYIQQGVPWDPYVIAYTTDDGDYRRADRPGHPNIMLMNQDRSPVNKKGAPQTLDFPKIEDQVAGVQTLDLKATSSSGLPVQFWVLSGPVQLDENNTTLHFLPIPPRTHFPMRVIIGAYQWGRATDPVTQSAAPVTQEFFIKGP